MPAFDLRGELAHSGENTHWGRKMQFFRISLAAFLLVSACGGNPFIDDPDDGGGGGSTFPLTGTTTDPSPNGAIQRVENKSTENGNGYAEDFAYDPETDTFFVDGLAFDGANVYQRGTAVASLGSVMVFEGDSVYYDDKTGSPIAQGQHRALYGVSTTGETEFAIVRTGAYLGYGFGGFVYQRNGSVTIPTSGQAHYEGEYAGMRDFNGAGGLEYTTGWMTIDIDFNDFNEGNAVAGSVTDRAVYDMDGNDITADIELALETEYETTLDGLPVLTFSVGPGVMDENGEITGEVGSYVSGPEGVEVYESGTYYAVMAGEDATEIAGIIVVESVDPRSEGVIARETGGFIVYNQ